ncbi:MAG: hypothetical protein ACOH2Q_19550 [Rhodococcus sp. (in: high G+C Gram-positive bacteria)]
MHSFTSIRSRFAIMVAGTAVATGTALTGIVMAGTAAAEPAAAQPVAAHSAAEDDSHAPLCTDLATDVEVSDAPIVCLPVDPFTEPNLTLEQRFSLVNPDSPIHDELIEQLEAEYGR